MAAFVLFVLAVAGGVTVADLAWENPTAGQVTVFQHTVGGVRPASTTTLPNRRPRSTAASATRHACGSTARIVATCARA